ncbi:MAG: cytochrome P450 [Gemmatimonadota bacterium]|jgi:cytochrome P450
MLPSGSSKTLRNTYGFAVRPRETMRHMRASYGDPFFASVLNGTLILTAEPELIREIFANRDPELFGVFASEPTVRLLGTHSLLTLSGEPHRRERKLLLPPFHGERMRSYGDVMVEAAQRAFEGLRAGEPFAAIDRTTDISLQAIVRAVFGVEDEDLMEGWQRAILATLDAAKPMFFFTKWTQRAPFGLGPWATYLRASAELDRLLYEQIEGTRGHTAGRDDILSLMIDARYEDGGAMTDEHIRDELRTLLMAGHETTAITLAWALYAVHRHPSVKSRLLAEVDALGSDPAPEELARLPYLNAVIDETLRLFPVVDSVFRRLLKPWSFGGYELPAGVGVGAAILLVHHREDLYPEPETFRPDRFLDGKPRPHEYLPFGGGNRRCIGAAFSHYESCVALATVLREFELELREPGEVAAERRNVTMGPKGGVRMRMLGRRRARTSSPIVDAAGFVDPR